MAENDDEIDLTAFGETDLAVENLENEFWSTVVVAGLQYYDYGTEDELAPGGRVIPSAGDRILLEREPGNHADRNAIRVIWRNSWMMGHIPRDLAADLAPEMDGGKGVRAYVIDPGHGHAWEMRILLVGPAIERMHGWRLERLVERRQQAAEVELRLAAAAVWGCDRYVEQPYGPDAKVGREMWRGRSLMTREPAGPAPTAAQADASARFEREIAHRRDSRRADAAATLIDLVGLYDVMPDGAMSQPDPVLRGNRFGSWNGVPAWLATAKTWRARGYRPRKEARPYATKTGGMYRSEYDLWAWTDLEPLSARSDAARRKKAVEVVSGHGDWF